MCESSFTGKGSLVIADFQTAGKGAGREFMGVGSWEEPDVQHPLISGFPSRESAVSDFPDRFPECKGDADGLYGFCHSEVAQRYLLERP